MDNNWLSPNLHGEGKALSYKLFLRAGGGGAEELVELPNLKPQISSLLKSDCKLTD